MEKNTNESVGIRGAKVVTTSSGKSAYRSTYENSEKWCKENKEDIRLRVPKGSKKLIQDYVKANGEKYRSINAFIIHLIEHEIGQKLDGHEVE